MGGQTGRQAENHRGIGVKEQMDGPRSHQPMGAFTTQSQHPCAAFPYCLVLGGCSHTRAVRHNGTARTQVRDQKARAAAAATRTRAHQSVPGPCVIIATVLSCGYFRTVCPKYRVRTHPCSCSD